jgi:hypothetical protein
VGVGPQRQFLVIGRTYRKGVDIPGPRASAAWETATHNVAPAAKLNTQALFVFDDGSVAQQAFAAGDSLPRGETGDRPQKEIALFVVNLVLGVDPAPEETYTLNLSEPQGRYAPAISPSLRASPSVGQNAGQGAPASTSCRSRTPKLRNDLTMLRSL